MKRLWKVLGSLVAATGLFLGVGAAVHPPPDTRPVLVQNLDLHDGQIAKFGNTYYQYGTMYGCGYQWYIKNTPWCGFGVSTAPSLNGPWSQPKTLFNPNELDPYTRTSWQSQCGSTGQGCFNPRMIQRSGWGNNDGAFILWFNSPIDFSRNGANAYNVMGCNSPEGPCGPNAGRPWGSYNKPRLDICSGNGDFGFIESGRWGQRPAMVCTMPGGASLNIQELNYWGSGGNYGVGVRKVAGMSGPIEGPGGYWDSNSHKYVLTYSDQGCGYCSGTPIGYATSPSLYSGWTAPGNVGWGAPAWSRRDFHPSSCGGQPRTVSLIDDVPYQGIDLWLGTRNEAKANSLYIPLKYQPEKGSQGDGQIWNPPLQLDCTP